VRFPKKWPLRVALATVGLVVVAVPIAWANDVFPDVPTANPHHNSINAIANAGVTSGCGGGFYCPANNVRRDEMATFLRQSSGRGARDQVSNTVTTGADQAIASITLTVPGNGFVLVNAATTFNIAGGPCEVIQRIRRPTSGDASFYGGTGNVTGGNPTVTNTLLSPVQDGAGGRIFIAEARIFSGSCTVTSHSDLNGVWIPFGSTGFSTPSPVEGTSGQTKIPSRPSSTAPPEK
jgi:hypothetical protein